MCIWFDVYMFNFDVYVFVSMHKYATPMYTPISINFASEKNDA